MKLRGL